MGAIEIKEVRSRTGWKPEGETIISSYGGGLFPANDAIEELKKWCNFERSALVGDILIIERDSGAKRN